MNFPFFGGGDKQKRSLVAEARWFRRRQNLQAILLVLLPAALLCLLFAMFFTGKSTPDTQLVDWNYTQALSGKHTPQELLNVYMASRAAFNEYIKRDVAASRLDHVRKLFKSIRSEADLVFALSELARVSGDQYAEVLTTAQYEDRLARQQGKIIGIDLEFQVQPGSTRNIYFISRCPFDSDAYAQGLREGDELFSIDETHIDQIAVGSPWEMPQRLKMILDNGLLGSTVKIVCKRDLLVRDEFVEAEVRRVVLGQYWPTFQAQDSSQQVKDSKSITLENLYNPETLPTLTELLRRYESDNVRGILLDIQQVTGSEGDAAIQLAALFMDMGVIAWKIDVSTDGSLFMRKWEALDGKVKLTVRGPFSVSKEGVLNKNAQQEDKVEILDWPSNVFTGQVVVTMGDETSGGGEVIAAALMSDIKRHTVTSIYKSKGKGMYQTYYMVGPDHVLALSTAYYLRPDGTSIEGLRINPNSGAPEQTNIIQWGYSLLEKRLRAIPVPDLPPPPSAPAGKPNRQEGTGTAKPEPKQ